LILLQPIFRRADKKKGGEFLPASRKPCRLSNVLGKDPAEKCSYPFRRKNQARAKSESREHFSAGHASGASGGGAVQSSSECSSK